jgi:hypothetical protein
MQEFDNTNRGALFKNDRKTKDSQPDYKGQLDVEGEEYWVAAWIKEGRNGKFMSISIQPKEELPDERPAERPAAAPARQPTNQNNRTRQRGQEYADMDDDIPF